MSRSFLLIHFKNPEQAATGSNALELVQQIPGVKIDLERRRAVIHGFPDTVSFNDEWGADELPGAIAGRAVTLLRRAGWRLYEERE